MIVDKLSQSFRYLPLSPRFAAAFDFLHELPSDQPFGRVQIDGDDCFALVQGYTTKPLSAQRFEAHRKYIDIQFLQAGRETLLWTPLAELSEVTQPYDDARDISFYAGPKSSVAVHLQAGEFAIFYPEDGHAPMLEFQGPADVRKVVIKVRV